MGSDPSINKASILVVDDKPDNLRLLTKLLTSNGYEVRSVPSGKYAISGANAIPPDLILLDVMMPEMDGFETCQHLKSSPGMAEIPVIFLTAKSDTGSVVRGFELGAVDYVTKPINHSILLARIKNHLQLKKRRDEQTQLIGELKHSSDNSKELSGLLPICSSCKSIRDDDGSWNQLESYIEDHSKAMFSHSLCPDCADVLYGDQSWYQEHKKKSED